MNNMQSQRLTNGIWTVVLLLLILVYQLKEILYPAGAISVGIATAELALCAVFLVTTLFSQRPSKVAIALMAIVGIILVSYLLSEKTVRGSMFGEHTTFTFFREFCGAVLPFFAFYALSRKGEIDLSIIKTFFVLSFLVAVVIFFHTMLTYEGDDRYADEMTLNTAYRFVFLLPYIGLFKRNWGFLFLAVALILSLISAKRGAILCVAVNLVIYAVYRIRESERPVRYVVMTVLVFVALAFVVRYIYDHNLYLQMRFEKTLEGNTSGRDIIISKLLTHYADNTTALKFLLGYGFCATVNIAGNYAHNDWFEFLIDTGLVGFAALSVFAVTLCAAFRRRQGSPLTLLLIISSILLPTLFSMVFFTDIAGSTFLLLGYVLGSHEYFESHDLAAVEGADALPEGNDVTDDTPINWKI